MYMARLDVVGAAANREPSDVTGRRSSRKSGEAIFECMAVATLSKFMAFGAVSVDGVSILQIASFRDLKRSFRSG